MTESEQELEAGRLLLRRNRPQERMACLDGKAARVARALDALARELRNPTLTSSVNRFSEGIALAEPHASHVRELQIPDREELIQLIEDRHSTHTELRDASTALGAYVAHRTSRPGPGR